MERLKEKESELLKKIEEVDLYRKNNGKPPSTRKTMDDLVKGEQSEELLQKG